MASEISAYTAPGSVADVAKFLSLIDSGLSLRDQYGQEVLLPDELVEVLAGAARIMARQHKVELVAAGLAWSCVYLDLVTLTPLVVDLVLECADEGLMQVHGPGCSLVEHSVTRPGQEPSSDSHAEETSELASSDVVGRAIRCGAKLIVSQAPMVSSASTAHDWLLKVVAPDELLSELLRAEPEAVTHALARQSAARDITVSEYLDECGSVLPQFVAMAKTQIWRIAPSPRRAHG